MNETLLFALFGVFVIGAITGFLIREYILHRSIELMLLEEGLK